MKIQLQVGNANKVNRYDQAIQSPGWETICESESIGWEANPAEQLKNVLFKFVQLINADDVGTVNNFFRVIIDDTVFTM